MLAADEILGHAMKADQQFSADLEARLGEMKRLENEWAAKRRTAKDVSSVCTCPGGTRLIFYRHAVGRMDEVKSRPEGDP